MLQRINRLFSLLVAAVATGLAFQAAASAGPVDQFLTGDPACNATNFRGSSVSDVLLMQEYIPDSPGTTGVDLCLDSSAPDRLAKVILYRGRIGALGDAVGAAEMVVDGATLGYVHFSFGEALFAPAGQKYVIAFSAGSNVLWRSRCGLVADACTSIDVDLYTKGISNRSDAADFGFRTTPGTPVGLPEGAADQKLRDDPPCNPSIFRGYASIAGPTSQEFVPSAVGLDAVDLCVQTFRADVPIRIRIRGSSSPFIGVIFATATGKTKAAGYQWVRIDLTGVLPTIPGARYVLEVTDSQQFQWRNTCPALGGSCPPVVDPDLYPPGSAPDGRDYGFRTLPGSPVTRRFGLVAGDR